jgi:hypothetical protein
VEAVAQHREIDDLAAGLSGESSAADGGIVGDDADAVAGERAGPRSPAGRTALDLEEAVSIDRSRPLSSCCRPASASPARFRAADPGPRPILPAPQAGDGEARHMEAPGMGPVVSACRSRVVEVTPAGLCRAT